MEDFKDKRELLEALMNCKADIKGAIEDGSNPVYKSKYSTLNSVLKAIKEPLHKWGLLSIQVPTYDDNKPILYNALVHVKTGQSLQFNTLLILSRKDSQAHGSAISYGRRYTLVSLLGISQTDDDGNTACSITDSQRVELELLLNGNKELKIRLLSHLKIKELNEIKYADFEIIKKNVIKRIEKEKDSSKEEVNHE